MRRLRPGSSTLIVRKRLNDKLSFYKTDEYRNPLLESLDEELKKRSLFSSDLKQLKTIIEERIRH